MITDVVYKVKPSDDNQELRYSIRSVSENWPDARIVIAGYKPTWLTGVYHIPVKQEVGQKHKNADRIVKEVLLSPTISDPCWLVDDDMFMLSKATYQEGYYGGPVVNWGPVQDILDSPSRDYLGSHYLRSMIETKAIMDSLGITNPTSHACHTPLLSYKKPLLSSMDYSIEGKFIQYSTIYGNQINLGGQSIANDIKVYNLMELPDWVYNTDYISTSDRSFSHGEIGRWLRHRFSTVSKYELWTP